MKNYYFKQLSCILFLFLFAFIADYYIKYVNVDIDSVVMKQLIMFIAISILFFVFNQLIYNYATKKKGFMQHRVWHKMFIVILIWLMISFVVFIFVFFATPLQDLIASHPWIMFIVAYYFLYFLNLLVLSIVHITIDTSVKLERKLLITWASSSLLIAIIIFMLPSF